MKRVFLLLLLCAFSASILSAKKAKIDDSKVIYVKYSYDRLNDYDEDALRKSIVNKVLKPYYEQHNCLEVKKDQTPDIIVGVITSNFSDRKVSYNDAILSFFKSALMSFDYQIGYWLPSGELLYLINGRFHQFYSGLNPELVIPELGQVSIRSLVPSKNVPITEIGDLKSLGMATGISTPKKKDYSYYLRVGAVNLPGDYIRQTMSELDRDTEAILKSKFERNNQKDDADLILDIVLTDYHQSNEKTTIKVSDGKGGTKNVKVDKYYITIEYKTIVSIPSGWDFRDYDKVYSFTARTTGVTIYPVSNESIYDQFDPIAGTDFLLYARLGRENRLIRTKGSPNANIFKWTGEIASIGTPNAYAGKDMTTLQIKVSELEAKISKHQADIAATKKPKNYSDRDSKRELYLAQTELAKVREAMLSSGNIGLNEAQLIEKIQQTAQQLLNDDYLKPREPRDLSKFVPAKITMKELPPAPQLVKDEFESTAQFEARIEQARVQRQKAVEQMQAKYAEEVRVRNLKVSQLESYHNGDLALIAQEQQVKLTNLGYVFPELVKRAFYRVMGKPGIRDLRYDADRQIMYGEIYASAANYSIRFSLSLPPEEARVFSMNQHVVLPEMVYKVSFDLIGNTITNQQMQLVEARACFMGKIHRLQLSDELFLPKQIAFQIQDVKLANNADSQLDLSLQDPMLVDRIMVDAIRMRDKTVNPVDDLSDLIARMPQAPEDDKKWLFLVGIENYSETHPVEYTVSSANAFLRAAKKKFGIKDSHIYSLIDKEATTAMIKNKLSLMLDRVNEGDVIYFYYCGHGMPSKDPSQDREVEYETYLIPVDGMPGLIYREPSLKTSLIYKQLTDSKASRVICFVDACFSGESDYGSMSPKGELAAALKVTKAPTYDKNKMVLFSAALRGQTARSYPEKGNRLFSYFLIKSLIDSPAEKISAQDLFKRYADQVRKVSYDRGDSYRQDPELSGKKDLTIN